MWDTNLDFIELGRKPEMNGSALGLSLLMKNILRSGKDHVSECYEGGNVDPKSLPIIYSKMEEMGGRLVYKFISKGYDSSVIWQWDHGMVDIENSGNYYINVSGFSKDEGFIREIIKTVRPMFLPPKKHGYVYAITHSGGRLAMSNLGSAGIPLIRGNYMAKVMEDYDFVVQDLRSSHPSGRIAIMEGEPGTGKTHLVRGLLLDVSDTMFVLVSPEMVPQLGGPDLLPLLMSHRHTTTGPIVLILEDADKCLVTREDKNISSIQSLLNLGDGILGSLLDLRIIATTNAKKLEMEQAIMRPGRLSRALRVGPLDRDIAQGVFRSLLPGSKMHYKLATGSQYTLAEVYSFAREAGWTPDSREKEASKTEETRKITPYDSRDADYEGDD